jgi:acyl carrier protein
VLEIVASVLGFPAAQAVSIDPQRPLVDEGLDSLSALQLTRHLKSRFGIDVPALRLIDGMSASQLSVLIGAEPGLGEMQAQTTTLPDTSPAAARNPANLDLDRLTDERVDDMLKELPQQPRGWQ